MNRPFFSFDEYHASLFNALCKETTRSEMTVGVVGHPPSESRALGSTSLVVMLSTHSQFLDKENQRVANPLRSKQTLKPAGQQGPAKRSFGVELSKSSQNASTGPSGPKQPSKKELSGKFQRSALGDITNRPAGTKQAEKQARQRRAIFTISNIFRFHRRPRLRQSPRGHTPIST